MPTYSKIIIAIIIAAGIAYLGNSLLFGLKSTEYDFRNAKWGMSPEEVEASENPELEIGVGDNFIFYQDKVAGYEALISYMFGLNDNDSLNLIAANYDFSADGLNADLGAEDFEKIKEFLTSKYGQPISKANINLEHGSLSTVSWETLSTEITLSLRDILGNGKYHIDAAFLSKRYKSEVKSTLDL